jgi:hypothetical protein
MITMTLPKRGIPYADGSAHARPPHERTQATVLDRSYLSASPAGPGVLSEEDCCRNPCVRLGECGRERQADERPV